VQYEKSESGFFWDHLNPQRLGVPRYQTLFRQVTWLFFLFGEVPSRAISNTAYEQSTHNPCRGMHAVDIPKPARLTYSPLDQLDPEHQFDEWEYLLYIMTLSFLIEGE